MVEGGIVNTEETDFTECWKVTWRTPYIMKLAFSAGIGGLLFGYDTGVISGALLYIKDEFEEVEKHTILQEIIVSTCVAGAIIGAAGGGYSNDRLGRKKTILIADVLFFLGSLVMAVAPAPWVIIIGRVLVGLGVGMASMTAPLYISEASPARIRGALVSMNGLLITGGQFLAYLINLAFTKAPGTWRWMLGIAGLPAVIQFVLMLSLPESPRWLYRENKVLEAKAILDRIYPEDEVEYEIEALRRSVEAERALEESIGKDMISKLSGAFSDETVRRALYAGVTVQVAQQFVGINTVMYYSPTIVQFAGFASKSVALALSLITSGLNALGSVVSMMFVDRYGRRRLMIISMFGIITCLVILAGVFQEASNKAPGISELDIKHFGANSTCPAYLENLHKPKWGCMKCLKAKCAFCANGADEYNPGACLIENKEIEGVCKGQGRVWFEEGCPSKIGFVAVVLLGVYILCYSPGMGTAPWIVNSEIYPLRYRGVGGGIAAVANWTSNLIVSLTFLSLTEALGVAGTFLLFAAISFCGLVAIYLLVPETKGLQFEEVERLLQHGFRPSLFRKKSSSKTDSV
ncbi:Inositol transporter 4 [Turnera subulata]|uniref:Inositol transporter 4 n=1 Tax=Turnera subulata TaxID=218843 RepID=A0A9Q0F053_9ROSI|nr:Inositol transporter 4 [Turnera subulata]